MKRHVRTLIWLVASGLIVVGLLEIGAELARHLVRQPHTEPPPMKLGYVVLGSVLLTAGIILFAFSRRLAERLAENFDE